MDTKLRILATDDSVLILDMESQSLSEITKQTGIPRFQLKTMLHFALYGRKVSPRPRLLTDSEPQGLQFDEHFVRSIFMDK